MPRRGSTFLASSRARRRLLFGLVSGVVVALLLTALRPTFLFRSLEGRAHDLKVRAMVGFEEPHPDLLLVAIDDVSLDIHLETLGRWPWPREVHGYVIAYLTAGGARALLYDIAFFDPDLSDPEGDAYLARTIAEAGLVVLPFSLLDRDAEDAARLTWLLGRGDGEQLLARHAVSRAVAGETGGPEGSMGEAGEGSADVRGHASALPAFRRDFGASVAPLPAFGRGAAGLGVMNLPADAEDGVVRRERLLYRHGDALYPSLALATARVLEPGRFGGAAHLEGRSLHLGEGATGERILLDRDGFLPLRWRGPFRQGERDTYPVIPVYQILNSYEQVLRGEPPDVPLDRFEGKVVVVGATAQAMFDLRTTPLAPHDPGMMIHATALDNLLSGDALRRWGPAADAGALLAVSVLVGAGTAALASSATLLAFFLLMLASAGTVGWALLAHHLGFWTDLATPLVGVLLAFTGAMVGNYVLEGRERRRIREMFGRYLAPEQVRILEEGEGGPSLSGERLPLTLLFSDIRGFTALSERLSPEEVIEILNRYLDRMTEIVFRNGGTLDKFMGDGLMAFWGAPLRLHDHAPRAVAAALEMLEAVDELNRELEAETGGTRLDIGIGIHTGEAVVGNIGSLDRKLDYTAVGDAVNLASRLESMNKELSTRALVSRATRDAAPEAAVYAPVGEVPVKGRSRAVEVFRLVGRLPVLILVAAFPLLLSAPTESEAQDRLRWSDRIYVPGEWLDGTLEARRTSDLQADSLALVALAEGFAVAPRWRIEFQTVEGGAELSNPLVMVGDGDETWVLTPLGSTRLEDHVLAEDPLALLLLASLAEGDRSPGSPVSWILEEDAGEVVRAIRRMALARTDFPDDLLAAGRAGRLGRQLLRVSADEVGDQRDRELVAAAGARGVRVRTVDGEVVIVPDIEAVLELERRRIDLLELDRFLREGGLGEEAGP